MKRWGAWIGLALIGLAGSAPAGALVAPARGFVIAPAFREVTVAPEQAQVQFDLKLTNATVQDQVFRLSAADFGALDEEGGVAFLGQPAHELDHRYGLASWLVLATDTVLVSAGQSARVPVTIENRASLAPGGHYGAVLATAVTEAGQSAIGEPRVGVRQVLSALVLVAKTGGQQRDVRLASQTTDAKFWQLPGRIDQRFHNAGNVHAVPRGTVEVRDPFDRIVARTAINAESSFVLPESFRHYRTSLTNVAAAWLPGRYSVVSAYRYDGTDQIKTLTTHVWYTGLAVVWIVGLLALGAVSLLGWWLWRRYRS